MREQAKRHRSKNRCELDLLFAYLHAQALFIFYLWAHAGAKREKGREVRITLSISSTAKFCDRLFCAA